MRRRAFKKRFAAVLSLVCACAVATQAQTATTTKRPAQGPVVVERAPAAPQVITVLHRISGFKMLRLLVRSGQPVSVIDNFDEALQVEGVHTNIIAGLAMDDGETIAAWLPEAEVEIEATFSFAAPILKTPAIEPPTPSAIPSYPSPMGIPESQVNAFFDRPDVAVIERDGTNHQARYVGLDGLTGLSLLQLSDKNLQPRPFKTEPEVLVGQRLHLYSPEPVREKASTPDNAIYIRLGETEGQVVSVIRGRSGEVSRIKIKAAKLSPSNIGAVVVNDGGQTIGIVESLEGSEASVLSPAAIRAAAKRVLTRQTSVPRPWLGISGEPVADATLDGIVRKGWETRRAMSLLQEQRGILLNSVIPHSPADQAALHAGDIIVQVNDELVTNTDDFSLLLAEAGAKPVQLTVVRPNLPRPKSIMVKLRQELDPMVWPRMFSFSQVTQGNPLGDHGIETVPVRTKLPVTRTVSGLLVINVDPASAAAKAGLKLRDVIEAIDDQPVSALPSEKLELAKTGYTLNVIRAKKKIVLTVIENEK